MTSIPGMTSLIKRFPCGNGDCTGQRKGKVVTVDLKHCYKIRSMEVYNQQKCCSKSGGNVVVSVGFVSYCNGTVVVCYYSSTVGFVQFLADTKYFDEF